MNLSILSQEDAEYLLASLPSPPETKQKLRDAIKFYFDVLSEK